MNKDSTSERSSFIQYLSLTIVVLGVIGGLASAIDFVTLRMTVIVSIVLLALLLSISIFEKIGSNENVELLTNWKKKYSFNLLIISILTAIYIPRFVGGNELKNENQGLISDYRNLDEYANNKAIYTLEFDTSRYESQLDTMYKFGKIIVEPFIKMDAYHKLDIRRLTDFEINWKLEEGFDVDSSMIINTIYPDFGDECEKIMQIDPDDFYTLYPVLRFVIRNIGSKPVTIYGVSSEIKCIFFGVSAGGSVEITPVKEVLKFKPGEEIMFDNPYLIEENGVLSFEVSPSWDLSEVNLGKGGDDYIFDLFLIYFDGNKKQQQFIGTYESSDHYDCP